ncbi:hypothetical protein L1887_36638 [Cichorium endivia]|nr:hypothetical protein L1887_36638 [Cichorium endivia]
MDIGLIWSPIVLYDLCRIFPNKYTTFDSNGYRIPTIHFPSINYTLFHYIGNLNTTTRAIIIIQEVQGPKLFFDPNNDQQCTIELIQMSSFLLSANLS